MQIIDTEKWREIFQSLGQHKLRTALTAFGVFWGIFMLTILLGAGKGLENGITAQFPLAKNAIFLWTGSPTQIPYQGMPVGRRIVLTSEQMKSIEENLPSISFIRGQNSVGLWGGSAAYTVYEDKSGSFPINGTNAGMEAINSMRIIDGRNINVIDDTQKRKVAVIGSLVKSQLFGNEVNPIGEYITLSGIKFLVIGTFESLSSGNERGEQEKIYIPNETLRAAFNQMGWVGSYIMLPAEGVHASDAERDVKRYLAEINKVSPDDHGVFGSFNMQKEFENVQGLFTGIAAFSWMVAIGTILAGAVGVGNIMLIVVKERTREIGLRKALGATPNSIKLMIVQEALLLTIVAGYSGLVVGVLMLEGVGLMVDAAGGAMGFFGKPQVDFETALTALGVLVLAGALASLMPATKAADVNPITALQDE
jgi:putative ABC transport system permease protein